MTTEAAKLSPAPRVLDELMARREQVVEKLMVSLVPGYPRRRRLPELEAGTRKAFDAIVASMEDGHRLVPDDVPFVREAVRRAALRGGGEAEILRGPLLAQRVIWDTIVELAADADEGRAAAVDFAPVLMDYVDVASQVTHEVYIEIHEALSSRANIVRFELLEELLGGREPKPGPKLNAARGCGLEDGGTLVVVVARAVEAPDDDAALPLAARALARAPGDALEPLAVVRNDEVVIVRATIPEDAGRLAEKLADARRALEADGLRLAVAVSTVYEGLRAIPAAYEEASVALVSMGDGGGLLALPAVSTLEYLILRAGDDDARQLVRPAVRDFIEEDLAELGVLAETLLAYVENGLNAKRTAESLHIHPNTAHYRLAKIKERTGCDLQRFDDLVHLVTAIRLASAR